MTTAIVLSFFPAFTPPSSGGEMRLGNLYRALSQTHDVVLLTSTDFGARFEEIVHTPRFRELRFPKDELWRSAYATLERSGLRGDLSGLAFALAVSDPSCRLRQRARQLALNADVVIHDFPYSEPVFNDGCPCQEIYNSHNFEVSLLPAIVSGDGLDEAILKLMRLEGNLVARAQRVLATSCADAEKFRLFYGVPASKLAVCPNGFDDAELAPVAAARGRRDAGRSSGPPRLLFIGSGHFPNVEGAKFLLDIAPALPDCEIVLAGGLCGALSGSSIPFNVTLVGPVDPTAKLNLLASADLFLNPVELGSGTSLKALEALGAAVPMVATPEGVRGLNVASGLHCVVASRSEFAGAIRRLLGDHARQVSLATEGLAFAKANFSWSQIASKLGLTLAENPPSAQPENRFLLALNDYSIVQGESGGIARIRNILLNLDQDVMLVTFGNVFDVTLLAERQAINVTVPKTDAHRHFESAVNDGQLMSVNDGVASLFAGSNRLLLQIVCEAARRASAVIFEHPYMATVLDALLAEQPDLPVVYSAHNVEATHKAEILRAHSIGRTLTAYIGELEQRLIARAHLIVCCTPSDRDYLAAHGACSTPIVLANGCQIPEVPESSLYVDTNGHSMRVGFLGSGHGPNVEAAEFIVRELAPIFRHVRFEMIGSVCEALRPPFPANVLLHGLVPETIKTTIMSTWTIGLNPLQSGGGSSLKVPDYLAHALVTLSTPVGARGLDIDQNDLGEVVELNQFRASLARMLGNAQKLSHCRQKARRYAIDTMAWRAITAPYREQLNSLSSAPQAHKSCRLLVVTYRYTEPSLGGAEEYLIEVLKRLRPRFARMDLAAVDVDQLTNHNHFGCRVSKPAGGGSRRVGELFDQMQFFACDDVPENEGLIEARNLEREWAREERTLLTPFADDLAGSGGLRLFGGFFWPENHDGVIRRWTSPDFSFLLPHRALSFHIAGYASASKTLQISLIHIGRDGTSTPRAQFSRSLDPYFSVDFLLPASESDELIVVRCEVDEHQVPTDHRPFGVLLHDVSVLTRRAADLHAPKEEIVALDLRSADLAEQHEEDLRTFQFERWVKALQKTASGRAASMETGFALLRGPHSRAMQAWLREHAHEYDTVLVQGIPFDVIPSTMETLKQLPQRPRVVLLPHFHADDRFYHWRRYYQSFADSDATLLFSSSIKECMSPNDRFVVVPGGGVRSDEHGDTAAAARFREMHRSTKPFYLALGRKTASKGYEQIIRAHQLLRRDGIDVDLVLIGPDEDGHPVEADGVTYLGRQPREVIRGALRSALALITMSRSESFGIVLCEAWLFGKPVIANRACYSFRELVRQGQNGILVGSDTELRDAMEFLVARPQDCAQMGQRGFEEVLQKYTWETVADTFYDALIPSQTRAQPVETADLGVATLEPKKPRTTNKAASGQRRRARMVS